MFLASFYVHILSSQSSFIRSLQAIPAADGRESKRELLSTIG